MDAFDYGMAFLFFYVCITLPMVLRSATHALAVCKPLQIQELCLTPRASSPFPVVFFPLSGVGWVRRIPVGASCFRTVLFFVLTARTPVGPVVDGPRGGGAFPPSPLPPLFFRAARRRRARRPAGALVRSPFVVFFLRRSWRPPPLKLRREAEHNASKVRLSPRFSFLSSLSRRVLRCSDVGLSFFFRQDERLAAAEARASTAEARVAALEAEKARPFFSGLGGTRKSVFAGGVDGGARREGPSPFLLSPSPLWGFFPCQATRVAVLETELRGEKQWTQGFQARYRASFFKFLFK